MYVYRVIDVDSVIISEGSDYNDAVETAREHPGSRIEVRRQRYGGPSYTGNNFGLLQWVRCETY